MFTVGAMTTTTTDVTSDRPRRRAASRSPQEQLFADTAGLRRYAVWRKARWIPDAGAAVDAAVWEAIQHGVSDCEGLYDAARQAAVAQRRYEMRHRRRLPAPPGEPSDLAARVAERIDAARLVEVMRSRVPAPDGDVVVWLNRKIGDGTEAMNPRVRKAGSRWSARARSRMGGGDDVA